MSSATDTITILGKTLAVDTVALPDGTTAMVVRDKIGFGDDNTYHDVNTTTPLPVILTGTGAAIALDTATLSALEAITINNPTDVSALATQTTLAAVLAKLPGDPATQTTVAAILAKLSGDPATQATLAAVLAKLPGDPATQTTLLAVLGALQGTLQTSPNAAGDAAATLADGRRTVTTPGVAVALGASTVCKWVTITALRTNTQQVNVGGSAVLAVSGSDTGTPLLAGDGMTIPVTNLNRVFVDARVAGEGVSYTVGS